MDRAANREKVRQAGEKPHIYQGHTSLTMAMQA
jgi:hypothetical protein